MGGHVTIHHVCIEGTACADQLARYVAATEQGLRV